MEIISFIHTLNTQIQNNWSLISGVGLLMTGLALPILLLIISSQINRKSKADELLYEDKRKFFEDFILLIVNIADITKEPVPAEMDRLMRSVQQGLMLYASKKTLIGFYKWRIRQVRLNAFNAANSQAMDKPENLFSTGKTFEDADYLINLLRKDLGIEDGSYSSIVTVIIEVLKYIIFLRFIFPDNKLERIQIVMNQDISELPRNEFQYIVMLLMMVRTSVAYRIRSLGTKVLHKLYVSISNQPPFKN